MGSQLYQVVAGANLALISGPDYNSPDGEYCCVITTVSGQRRCVTLSEWDSELSIHRYKITYPTHPATCPMLPFPANGRITYDPDTNVATYSCDPGYALSNTGQRTCGSDNQWSGTTVTCERMGRENAFVL